MSDLISRQAAIDAIRASTSKFTGFMEMEMYTDDNAVEAIKGLPSVQSEIIRCKDCKHSHPWYADRRTCVMWSETGESVFNDDYCSRGERKDE